MKNVYEWTGRWRQIQQTLDWHLMNTGKEALLVENKICFTSGFIMSEIELEQSELKWVKNSGLLKHLILQP